MGSSWWEGRLGGSGRACSRDELGSEEIGGDGSGEEEERRALVRTGSMEVRGGMGGRCMVTRVEDVDGVGRLGGGLADSEWGRGGFAKPERGWCSGMKYTRSSGGEWQWNWNSDGRWRNWEGSQTSMGIRWDDAGRSTDMPSEAWRREGDEEC